MRAGTGEKSKSLATVPFAPKRLDGVRDDMTLISALAGWGSVVSFHTKH
jgi:hypothetical protein